MSYTNEILIDVQSIGSGQVKAMTFTSVQPSIFLSKVQQKQKAQQRQQKNSIFKTSEDMREVTTSTATNEYTAACTDRQHVKGFGKISMQTQSKAQYGQSTQTLTLLHQNQQHSNLSIDAKRTRFAVTKSGSSGSMFQLGRSLIQSKSSTSLAGISDSSLGSQRSRKHSVKNGQVHRSKEELMLLKMKNIYVKGGQTEQVTARETKLSCEGLSQQSIDSKRDLDKFGTSVMNTTYEMQEGCAKPPKVITLHTQPHFKEQAFFQQLLPADESTSSHQESYPERHALPSEGQTFLESHCNVISEAHDPNKENDLSSMIGKVTTVGSNSQLSRQVINFQSQSSKIEGEGHARHRSEMKPHVTLETEGSGVFKSKSSVMATSLSLQTDDHLKQPSQRIKPESQQIETSETVKVESSSRATKKDKLKKFRAQKLAYSKVCKPGKWPNESIVNQYVKASTFAYQTAGASHSAKQLKQKKRYDYDELKGQMTIKTGKNGECKNVDRLFKMHVDEKRASARIQEIKKKRRVDVGRKMISRKTEVKFRELYEGQLPPEFGILPNPESLFQDEKIRLELLENEPIALVHVKQSQKAGHVSFYNQFKSSQSNRKIPMEQQQHPIIKKKSTIRTAPGILSNNWRKSNQMDFVTKEHNDKVKQIDKQERRRQHYQGSIQRSLIFDPRLKSSKEISFNGRALNRIRSASLGSVQSSGSKPHERQTASSPMLNLQKKQRQIIDSKNLLMKGISQYASALNLFQSSKQQQKQKYQSAMIFEQQRLMRLFQSQRFTVVKNYPGMNLTADPIHTSQRLYKHVILVALKKSHHWHEVKQFDSAISVLHSVIPLSQAAFELQDSLLLYKLIATIEFARKAFTNALNVCHLVTYICGAKKSLQDIRLEMLKLAGLCRMKLAQYQEAIHAWKLCFEHALRTNNESAETECYEQMSFCYFNLGQMQKAEYFNTRYLAGVLEEPDSQIRVIYASLRNRSTRSKDGGSWLENYAEEMNQSVFEVFYKKFSVDCKRRKTIVKNLMRGKVHPILDKNCCRLSKHIAVHILSRVGKMLRDRYRKKEESPDSFTHEPLHLEQKWRKSYFFQRCKYDCQVITNLRAQIYQVCKDNCLTDMLPSDLQYEIELISDFLKLEEIAQASRPVKQVTENRYYVPQLPKLGKISEKDYDVLEMPSPTMQNIESVRFDFKSAMRNKDFRQGKQYESFELRKLCPHLFVKNFKKDAIPRQLSTKEMESALPSMNDSNYKANLIQRAHERKSHSRDLIYMSHMSRSRSTTGKFTSEKKRKAYQLRHFRALTQRIITEIAILERNLPDQHPKDIDQAILQASTAKVLAEDNQMKQSKLELAADLPMRAFIYGQSVTRALINQYNIDKQPKDSNLGLLGSANAFSPRMIRNIASIELNISLESDQFSESRSKSGASSGDAAEESYFKTESGWSSPSQFQSPVSSPISRFKRTGGFSNSQIMVGHSSSIKLHLDEVIQEEKSEITPQTQNEMDCRSRRSLATILEGSGGSKATPQLSLYEASASPFDHLNDDGDIDLLQPPVTVKSRKKNQMTQLKLNLAALEEEAD